MATPQLLVPLVLTLLAAPTPSPRLLPTPTPHAPPSAATPSQAVASTTSQQCGGITDPFCYVIDAFVSGPVALLGSLDGSPDPAHVDPSNGSVTTGPWHLITTLVGTNPMVDNYNGDLGEPAHECGSAGCLPWVQTLNRVLLPLSLTLLVLAFAVQVALFMVGQQLNLRAGIVPCLVSAAILGAGLPLHLAGRVIDAGSWLSQGIVQQTFGELGASGGQPLDMMTVLAITAYCPEDSPIVHPGVHLSLPGPSPRQQVLIDPWMDPHFTQSHCVSAGSPDFTKEVLDRSENFFGPPLHDANCDRGDAAPAQPLCTNTDNQVNFNQGQLCLEGSGGSGLAAVQLGVLPLAGEPRAGNGQRAADCRYADIYWGTVPSFTDVWAGVGPHGRNGYDVPDGPAGMVAFTVLTILGLWLAMTYLGRFIVLALLAGCSSLAFVLLALPGGRPLFARYWTTVASLSAVVVIQTLVFLAFVAVVSTVSGLGPAVTAGRCPLLSPGASSCSAHGLLSEVGKGNPGDQFAKCLLAVVTVWLMLEVPRRLGRSEFSAYHGVRGLAGAVAGVAVGGVLLAGREGAPRAARFGARVQPALARAVGVPSGQDRLLAAQLEDPRGGGEGRWPQVEGREGRAQFMGRFLAEGRGQAGDVRRRLGVEPADLRRLRDAPPGADRDAQLRRLGERYVAAGGALVPEADAAYLNALRRGRLRPTAGGTTDPTSVS